MTHLPIETLPDGTRVYSNGMKYKPVPEEERVYARLKPDDPEAVFFKGEWWIPMDFIPDEWRPPFPETRPDTDAYDHMTKPRKCRCYVCLRPESEVWKAKWLQDHPELRSVKRRRRRRGPGRSGVHPPTAGTAVGSSADPSP